MKCCTRGYYDHALNLNHSSPPLEVRLGVCKVTVGVGDSLGGFLRQKGGVSKDGCASAELSESAQYHWRTERQISYTFITVDILCDKLHKTSYKKYIFSLHKIIYETADKDKEELACLSVRLQIVHLTLHNPTSKSMLIRR